MFQNYLLLALRNLKKQRGYAIVNIFGLSIGLASALFIFLYVTDELTFDKFHPYADQTYRLGYRVEFPNGEHEAYPAAPAGWDNYIKDTYPGITAITSYSSAGMPTSIHNEAIDKVILTEDIIWAESNLQEILKISIKKGAASPLKEMNSIILSETSASELFGTEDPINKVLSLSHQYMTHGQKMQLMVTAVYEDMPSNTHIQPKYIVNILSLKSVMPALETLLNTSMGEGNDNYWTQSFFVCTDESKIPLIEADFRKRADEIIKRLNLDFKFKPLIRKITDVHFDDQINWSISHKSVDPTYIYVFTCIALLILIVACINYINLATAKSVNRAKEIGLRKTFGGFRLQLFIQFMTESFVLVLIATLIAVLLVILLIPQFNDMTGKAFSVYHIVNVSMLQVIGGIVIFVTVVAGSYPALFVSGFQPASVLKGKFIFGGGSNLLRQFLTTIQFVVAVVLLSGTVIVVRQMDMMRNSTLNAAGKQIISIRYGGFTGPATDEKYNTFKNIVGHDPEIEAITLANHLPRLDYFGPINMRMQFPEISEEQHEWFQLNGDFDFAKTFKLKIIAGRDFNSASTADSTAVLLNEAGAKALKLSPGQVIGKRIVRPAYVMSYAPVDSTRAPVMGSVIGVVEDFPYRSMHRKIDPLAIAPKPHTEDRIIHIRLPAGKISEKIASIEKTWKQVYPDFGFDYWFIDEEFARMYENEVQVAELTEKFSALAILITCVGLYGLASFLAEQRTKEIGIRKALGASNVQILVLQLKTFAKLLGIACLVGLPIAFYLASQWLESFVYQTSLSFMVFAGAVGLIALITTLTVGYESLKASMTNPIEALKHE
jgi:putative ABC transport system permease protein